MDELIARLAARLEVPPEVVANLVGIVLKFLDREAPEDAMRPLLEAHPWIEAVLAATPADEAPPASERHFGGMARLMQVADRMMALGLTMPQVQTTVHEVVAYARVTVGDAAIDTLVRSIPGLRQVA